jgi:hypothetical protein
VAVVVVGEDMVIKCFIYYRFYLGLLAGEASRVFSHYSTFTFPPSLAFPYFLSCSLSRFSTVLLYVVVVVVVVAVVAVIFFSLSRCCSDSSVQFTYIFTNKFVR